MSDTPVDPVAYTKLLMDAMEQIWATGKAVIQFDGVTVEIDYTEHGPPGYLDQLSDR